MAHSNNKISQKDICRLQDMLAEADAPGISGKNDRIELVVFRKGYVRVSIGPDRNHARPHFHIKYKTEFSASYALEDFSRLVGEMPQKYEAIVIEWAKGMRKKLLVAWGKLKKGDPDVSAWVAETFPVRARGNSKKRNRL